MPKKWKVETEQIQQFANPISIHFQLCQGQDASVSGASRVSAIEIWSLAESSGKAVDWGNLQKSLVTDELKVSYGPDYCIQPPLPGFPGDFALLRPWCVNESTQVPILNPLTFGRQAC